MGLFSWVKRRFTTALAEARGIERVVDNVASLANHARRMHDHGDVDDLHKAIKKAVRKYKKLKDAREKQKLMEYVFRECQQSADALSKENDDMIRIFHETLHILTEMRDDYGKKLYENVSWLEHNQLSAVDATAGQNIRQHYQELMTEINQDLLDYRRGTRRQKRRRKRKGKARFWSWFVGAEKAEKEINQDADEIKKIIRGLRDDFTKLEEAETIDVNPQLVEEAFTAITTELLDILAYLEEIVLDYFIATAEIRKDAVNEMVKALKPVYSVDPLSYKRLEQIPRDMDAKLKAASTYAYRGARKAAA